jgi:hypothetical protein
MIHCVNELGTNTANKAGSLEDRLLSTLPRAVLSSNSFLFARDATDSADERCGTKGSGEHLSTRQQQHEHCSSMLAVLSSNG